MSDFGAMIPLHRALDGCTELRYRAIRPEGVGPPMRTARVPLQDCQLTTSMCGQRGCKWCDYKLRSRHKPKLRRLGELVSADSDRWRFFTFTLPGSQFAIRNGSLREQLDCMRSSLTKWRDRQRDNRGTHWARLGKITGSYVIEHPYNADEQWWHLHTHALIKVPQNFDDSFSERISRYNRQWLECVDKPRYKELLEDGTAPGSPLDVEKVTSDGLDGYMTKATGYLSKGQGYHLKDEVSEVMSGRCVFNTWGELRGTDYGRI